MSFEQRMEARKLKELQEAAEQGKQAPVMEYEATVSFNVLGTDWNNAEDTLKLVIKLLSGFEDLSGVKGEFV